MIGGDRSLSGAGMLIGSTSLSTFTEMVSIFSSILTRDCARRAFDPLPRSPQPPAAGDLETGPLLVGGRESEAGQDSRRARWSRMRADVGEPRLDVGDAVRIVRGFGFGKEAGALDVGLEHDLEQAFRPIRR